MKRLYDFFDFYIENQYDSKKSPEKVYFLPKFLEDMYKRKIEAVLEQWKAKSGHKLFFA